MKPEQITLRGVGKDFQSFVRAWKALEYVRKEPETWRGGGLITFGDGTASLHIKKTKTGWTISCTKKEDCNMLEDGDV